MSQRTMQLGALVWALAIPTCITWLYFIALREYPAAWQQLTYAAGKTVQFGFPLLWVFVCQRRPLRPPRPVPLRHLLSGLGFGVAIGAAMLALYFLVLGPRGFFDVPAMAIREKISGLGLTQRWKYALVGVFYAVGHSLLEEYYWRWFVFRQLQRLVSLPWAVTLSSLGFMAHHVLVLATYFGWDAPATWLFSAAVAVGGAVWALQYRASRSLFVPWAGHCLVDAAIFAIGYHLAQNVMV